MQRQLFDVIIIGGGLAGLSAALHLSQTQLKVLLIEKQSYPHHKVCGEYVSNEVLPYLKTLGVDPFEHGAIPLKRFEISTQNGDTINSPLPLGGFGISRYTFDHLLYKSLLSSGNVLTDLVTSAEFVDDSFEVNTRSNGSFKAKFVIGAFGKRSLLDKSLEREFIEKRTHWMAVKAHFKYDFPDDLVALHSFEGGYCGLSRVESGTVNACYLTTTKSFNTCSSIEEFEHVVMSRNPNLKRFFTKSESLFDKPLTISQISFSKKAAVEDHIFMIGDSAGLIHPLCGNGMAMAIHSGKIVSELLLETFDQESFDRKSLEETYERLWNKAFSSRLKTGSLIQKMLLSHFASNMAFKIATRFPSVLPRVIEKTHGSLLV